MAQMSKFKTIPLNLIITINFACVGVSPEMKTKRLLLKIDTNLSIYFISSTVRIILFKYQVDPSSQNYSNRICEFYFILFLFFLGKKKKLHEFLRVATACGRPIKDQDVVN
jgi:hypothetical protein